MSVQKFVYFLTLFLSCKFQCRCRRNESLVQTVCGQDGITYKNPCYARCNDAQIAYEGACSRKAVDCNCPLVDAPVCDIQGQIYQNECVANCKGKVAIPFQWCSVSRQQIENDQKEIPLVIRYEDENIYYTSDNKDYNYKDNDYDDISPMNLYYGVDIVNYYLSRHTDEFSGLRQPQRRNSGEIS